MQSKYPAIKTEILLIKFVVSNILILFVFNCKNFKSYVMSPEILQMIYSYTLKQNVHNLSLGST